MKVNINKALALSGACALFLTAGMAAMAQDRYDHRMDRDEIRVHAAGYHDAFGGMTVERARREIMLQKRAYDHEIRSNHPALAMKAHLRAKRIREWLRAHNAD